MGSETRKRETRIQVRVSSDERQVIESNASKTGLSTPEYLRRLGQGYKPKSIEKSIKINELIKVAGDLGRVGGLLKLLLTDREKLLRENLDFSVGEVQNLLSEIEDQKQLLKEKIMSL